VVNPSGVIQIKKKKQKKLALVNGMEAYETKWLFSGPFALAD